jgi:hypothetical protein
LLAIALAVGVITCLMAIAIAIVGSCAAWLRLDQLDAPAFSGVTGMPFNERLAWGARVIIGPAAAAAAALVALLLVRARGSDAEQRNLRGLTPWGLTPVLAGLIAAVLAASLVSEVSDPGVATMVGIAVLGACVVRPLVRTSEGQALGLLIVGVACMSVGVIVVFVYEVTRPSKLDMAAVVRNDGSALGGFLISRSGDEIVLLLGEPGARATISSAAIAPALPKRRCVSSPSTRASQCYTNAITAVAEEDVAAFYVGPVDVGVTADSHRQAHDLARRALASQGP